MNGGWKLWNSIKKVAPKVPLEVKHLLVITEFSFLQFHVNKLRMLSVVGWPPSFPATYCLDGITEMLVTVCTLVPTACRSCCNLLILGIHVFQLLCQHFKVKSLIMISQAHSLLLAVDSVSLCSDLRSASAQNRLNQQ